MRGSLLAAGCWLSAFLLPFAIRVKASELATVSLFPAAQVDGEGIFLQQVVEAATPLPALKLCAAPAFGKVTDLSRAQVHDLIAAAAPDLATTNWQGAEAIHISRRTHEFSENALRTLLTATLQSDSVKDKGELELIFQQPWAARVLPDEPLTLKILELPTAGVAPSFIVRFELRTAREAVGTWQVAVQAHVWREVWVAHTTLKRGDLASEADLARERRDVLNIREPLANFASGDPTLEFAESVSAGTPVLARVLKPKTVIHRGQTATAMLEDGSLSITMKVQALEDGAPGQMIRFRNPTSARNASGKVLNEQTILISL